MPEINIANSAGRDAQITVEHVTAGKRVRWIDEDGRQALSIRVIKAPSDRDFAHLERELGGVENLTERLIREDVEVDLEVTGTLLREVSRVYIDKHGDVAHRITAWEIVLAPDGTVRERRIRERSAPNVATDIPLRWSGIFISKADAYRRFVFSTKLQLRHINGLTYDFLYGMAKELHERNSLMLLGAGPKSNQPLILRRGTTPYRGFLEGRIEGDRYCLLLHLSNQELKLPEEKSE